MGSIVFELKNGVGFITLNRPEKYNAFNREMAMALQQALDECESDSSIRCVFIAGAGKAFSAGQDLSEIVDRPGTGIQKIHSEHYNPVISKIRNLNKPVVAAVNGIAAGAGANIALCCDVVIAAQSASFMQAFSKIGLIPDSGGTFFLPRLIGMQKATAFMMLADKIPADEAERLGMIYKVFPDNIFKEKTKKIAWILADMPTKGLGYTKQALNKSMEQPLDLQLLTEEELKQKAALTKDFAEGVSAFLQKRKPNFTGE